MTTSKKMEDDLKIKMEDDQNFFLKKGRPKKKFKKMKTNKQQKST